MLTRKKRSVDEANPHVTRSRAKTESADSSKGKKKSKSKECPDLMAKNTSRKSNVPLNVPNTQISRTRKRKAEADVVNKDKKLKRYQKNQKERVKKTFCWICHKPCQTQICACSRVYHSECLIKASKEFDGNICPECKIKSVDGTTLTRPFSVGLKVYLECATNWLMEKYKNEMFMSWPQNPGNNKIVPAIDIQTLMKKVQNGAYNRTSEFYSDAKWIHHSTCILYGEKSKEAMESKKLIKDVKEELIDMEACPECYYYLYCKLCNDNGNSSEYSEPTKNLHYEKSFVRICNPPHDIVWAKVTGYSHWPAKCLKVVNGKAHVRFFGKHEKSDVPIDTIFHISKIHPVYEYRNITDTETRTSLEYTYAKRELLRYISLYEKNIGEFRFYEFREFYATENDFQTEKNFEQQKRIAQRSQLELSSSTNPTSESSSSEAPSMTDEHPEITLPNHISNVTSVSMTFSVDGCGTRENPNYGNMTSANVASPTNISEQNLSESILNCSAISTGTPSEIQVKEELSDLVQTQQSSSDTEPSNRASVQFIQVLRSALNNPSESFDLRNTTGAYGFLANILQSCISPTNADETHFPVMPDPHSLMVKEEDNLCPNDNVSSPSQIHELEEGNTANVTECASATADNNQQDSVPCSSNKVIAVIDLTSEEDDMNGSSSALVNILMENPQMCSMFQQVHQKLNSLLAHLCLETSKKHKLDSNRRCEAFSNKLNETERRFREETEKLRDEIKCLKMSLASEKEKNTIS